MSDVWHRIEITTHPDGSATVSEATNDDLDRGYPTESAYWHYGWDDAEKAKAHHGKSRIGCLGAEVTVTHDGVKV